MEQGDLAIMVVRQLADGYEVFDNTEVTVKVGDTYISDNVPCSVYTSAVASLGHHPYSCDKKYLQVRLLSEPVPVIKNDVRFSIVDKIEVVREISLEELRQNPDFDTACAENEKAIKEKNKKEKILEHYTETGVLSEAEKKGLLYDAKGMLKLIFSASVLIVIWMLLS